VFTERLRLEPVDVALTEDLRIVYQDPDVATWAGGGWTHEESRDVAAAITASVASGYSPRNTGGRLSWKARMPSM
jgi:hypothetical protein